MGIEFEFFEAGHGDSILVSTDEGTNILIDGGISKTYKDKKKSKKSLKFKLRTILTLDLVVLTHIDDDHICGLIQLIKDDEHSKKIEKLWFNSFLNIGTINVQGEEISHGSANYFLDLISKHKLTHYDNIFLKKGCNKYFVNNDIELILLSPLKKDLVKLEDKWTQWNLERERLGKGKRTFCNGHEVKEISSGIIHEAKEEAVNNRSSIAFILKYKNQKFLFLADADINIINDSLERLGYSEENPIDIDFVKLSHHGSKNNINENFLDLIETDSFIILTNGHRFGHPHQETINLIMKHKPKNKHVDFIFNYDNFFKEKFSKYDKVTDRFNAYYKLNWRTNR